MLECAELVNEVLCKPLQSPLIGEVFDGVVAGRLYHQVGPAARVPLCATRRASQACRHFWQASKGASVSVLLNKVGGNLEQFTAMYDAVVEGIENQLQVRTFQQNSRAGFSCQLQHHCHFDSARAKSSMRV